MDSHPARARIQALDVWRSLCVAIMVVYHGFYDLALSGRLDMAVFELWPLRALRYVVAGSFILISGAVSGFSRSPARRGALVLCAAAAVETATALVGSPVRFGILHLLGVSMLVCAALGKRTRALRAARSAPVPALCAAVHFAMLSLCSGTLTRLTWLYPLGFKYPGFYSADYYPLLPWLPVFLLGVWLGGVIERHRDAPLLSRRYSPWVTFAGRHSLIIYLAHQPLLYGLCLLLSEYV